MAIAAAVAALMMAAAWPSAAVAAALPQGVIGAWIPDGADSLNERLAIRRNELVHIKNGKVTHGTLAPQEGRAYRHVVDFVDGTPKGRIETVKLYRDGAKLMVARDGGPPRAWARFAGTRPPRRLERKGFSYVVPEGWVSNVEIYATATGKEPSGYDTDQLVRYYETGVEKPTEDMTIRLVQKPFEEVMAAIDKKLSNPRLFSRRSDVEIGGRKGAAFENSATLGQRRVSAKVYILRMDGASTLQLAVPTLLPSFPFDLDAACRALLNSVKTR